MRKFLLPLLFLALPAFGQYGGFWTKPATTTDITSGTLPASFSQLCIVGPSEVCLFRDAANVLAQRNGANAQVARVYNTFTDASNYARLRLDATGTTATVATEALGTGTLQQLKLTAGTGGFANFSNSGVGLGNNATTNWNVNSSGHLMGGTDNTYDIGASGATRPRNLYLGSSVKQVGGVTTSGLVGTPAIVATGRLTAQTAAQASVSTFTVGAADGSFQVSANVLVTTATTHSFSVTVAYTDEGNTARVLTLNFTNLAGTFSTLIVNTGGAVPYESPVFHIRCKAATAITIATTGTFTTVTYNVEGIIKQVS